MDLTVDYQRTDFCGNVAFTNGHFGRRRHVNHRLLNTDIMTPMLIGASIGRCDRENGGQINIAC